MIREAGEKCCSESSPCSYTTFWISSMIHVSSLCLVIPAGKKGIDKHHDFVLKHTLGGTESTLPVSLEDLPTLLQLIL